MESESLSNLEADKRDPNNRLCDKCGIQILKKTHIVFFSSPTKYERTECVCVSPWTQRNVDDNSSSSVNKKKKLHCCLFGKRFWRLSPSASFALRRQCGVEPSGTTDTNTAQRYNEMKLVLILTRENPAVASMRWERKRRGSAKTRPMPKESRSGSNFL